MNRLLIWWQALNPLYKTFLLVIGGAAVIFLVVEIPHRQAAPLKAKIQRERGALQPHERLQLEHDARKLENDARTALIQGLGGAALLIGLLFTWRSIRVTERNLQITQENLQITQDTAAKNLAIAQDGQITERFTRAVEQLGSDKSEMRLGAIYALERIARDSERDHWPIMEILTAYVRENASWNEEEQSSQEGIIPSETQPPQSNQSPPKPATDIQAILTVLGRRTRTFRKGEEQRLDLGRTALRGALLWDACLEGADLGGADLEGASLRGAHLEGARSLRVEQLATVYTLCGAHLDPPLLAQIQQQHPHLLEVTKN